LLQLERNTSLKAGASAGAPGRISQCELSPSIRGLFSIPEGSLQRLLHGAKQFAESRATKNKWGHGSVPWPHFCVVA
jgi:hypothetical protein